MFVVGFCVLFYIHGRSPPQYDYKSNLWWICATRIWITHLLSCRDSAQTCFWSSRVALEGWLCQNCAAHFRVHRNKDACSQSNPPVIGLHLVQAKHFPAWIIVPSIPTTIDASTPRMKPDRRSVVQQRCTFNKILSSEFWVMFKPSEAESCIDYLKIKRPKLWFRSRCQPVEWNLLSQSHKCALHAAN